jgi:transcription-repair coupling factor (superfamily II helicase)
MITQIRNIVHHLPAMENLAATVERLAPGAAVPVSRLHGSLDSLVIASLSERSGSPILVITHSGETALRISDDLKLLLEPGAVHRIAGRNPRGRSVPAAGQPRTEEIEAIRGLIAGTVSVVIAEPGALSMKFPAADEVGRFLTTITSGEERDHDGLVHILREFRFERKEFIEEAGDYALRGGILDVFPYVGENPVRIEFCGNVVESIREFDPLSQRSIRTLAVAHIVPDLLSFSHPPEGGGSLFDYIGKGSLVVMDEPDRILAALGELREQDDSGWSAGMIREKLAPFRKVEVSSYTRESAETVDFRSSPQRAFNGSIRLFREHLRDLLAGDARILIACESQTELRRLKELLESPDEEHPQGTEGPDLARITFIHHSLHEGFELPSDGVAFFTEHQVFLRKKRRGRGEPRGRGLSVQDIQRLRKDDYVVHSDYGIGRFAGLRKIEIRGVGHEVLRILYEEGDVLYVNLNYVNRVQKYSSKEGHIPQLTRLGSAEWQKLKSRAKKRMKDIARDLIRLYAERKKAQGFAFGPDTSWQREMEASFVFEDTFDQAKATVEVKQDMELPHPMDRLVCGDVGFGKTEVAVRAAFKAVLGGKQAAVLVPTTILALQHYNTFVDRLSNYPVRIEVLSRLKPKAAQDAILEKLRTGEVDIIIGTHRLLSKDVGFRDLGLLIIDEEHRFGVGAKERLRLRKANVDTLTLTATPIPRTLHFSLMGARDLSLITTPPRNRVPIITEIVEFNEGIVKEAVLREIGRNGQVYVVHDRVSDIAAMTDRIRDIVGGVGVRYAHGQMHARDLEKVMVEFLERKFEVLVSTKIIESGLDIPNVNTILILRADRFGMAELYQLRGRVGRSNIQAYAYLMVPPLQSLPAETLRRLGAMKEFTELGSGFNVAMRDLEIRGAGNLLGSEQSGFIANMGFETYMRTLEEAMAELKEEEFGDVFGKAQRVRTDGTIVEAGVEALIPAEYIGSDEERLGIYRRLYAVETREQVLELGAELADRFGSHPPQVEALLKILQLRLEGARCGITRIKIEREYLELEIPPPPESIDDGRWNDFIAGVSAMKDPPVTLREKGKSLVLKVGLSGEGELLMRAGLAFHSVTRSLYLVPPVTQIQA